MYLMPFVRNRHGQLILLLNFFQQGLPSVGQSVISVQAFYLIKIEKNKFENVKMDIRLQY